MTSSLSTSKLIVLQGLNMMFRLIVDSVMDNLDI
jgi:hypothetical protein